MQNNAAIPFLDLITPHHELEEELVAVFREALRTAGFIGGPMVEGFERDFAAFCGTKQCVGVANGTDALRFALMAAGVQKGDTVVTVPNTFIATTEAISQAGGTPDFVDVDERTFNMNPDKLAEYLETGCELDDKTGRPISRRTGGPVKAIIPVHLYGQPAHMDPILDLAERYDLLVIEDACQAHGAEYYSERERVWKKAGSISIAAAFSFYPGKNLGACGEAGAVTTNSAEIAIRVKMLRDHGQRKKYFHDIEGYNGRLDAVQAGILRSKLGRLEMWNSQRRLSAGYYDDLLKDINGITAPHEAPFARSVYHLYVVRSSDRDNLQRSLSEKGIATGLHYPVPLHLQEAYKDNGYRQGDFPIAEAAARTILSLPMFPGLTKSQQEFVAQSVMQFSDSKTPANTSTSRV